MNQKISGLYKGIVTNLNESKVKTTELELRVDVDGANCLNIISGDLYLKSKSSRRYLSSFIFQEIMKIEIPTDRILLVGNKGKFSLNSIHFTKIEISISKKTQAPKATFLALNGSRATIQG